MQAYLLHLQAAGQTRVGSFQLRELRGRIILWEEAPKDDMEERAHLSQGALSLVWVLADGEEEKEGAEEEAETEEETQEETQEAEGSYK